MPHDIRDQLRRLLQLQTIDARVHELRAAIDALPKKLAALQGDLAKLEDILRAEGERLAETEAWRKEQESLNQDEEEAIRKARGKLQGAKNSKDYTAANRELDNKRRSKSEREDELIKVMEVMDKSRGKLRVHEDDIAALRARVQDEEQKMSAQVAELTAEMNEHIAGRDSVASQLDGQLLKRYQHIARKRGIAVAPVDEGVCQGCHMAIPPQLNNILAGLDSIESCPRCNRLLYRFELLDPPAADAASEPTPKA